MLAFNFTLHNVLVSQIKEENKVTSFGIESYQSHGYLFQQVVFLAALWSHKLCIQMLTVYKC